MNTTDQNANVYQDELRPGLERHLWPSSNGSGIVTKAYGLTVLIPIKHGTENNRSYDKIIRDRLQQ